NRFRYGSIALPGTPPKNLDQFAEAVQQIRSRIARPARVTLISTSALVQSAPPDTLQPAKKKTYAEAIELLRRSAERTAQKFEPLISKTAPAEAARDNGEGFFFEGDNQTGE